MSRVPARLEDHAAGVRSRLAEGGPVLVALDFDGTLTEIVDDPGAATLTPERRRVLARVPGADRWLAIVSGRALADVRERVGLERAIYVGNHGIEIEGPGLSLGSGGTAGLPERLTTLLASLHLDPATEVENKILTATLHVRPRGAVRRHSELGPAIRDAVEAAGFVVRPGKASWEIRPRDAPTKGGTLRRLIAALPGASPERTVYIGDDATDEDAFRAIPDGVTVRVGPPETDTAARYQLPSPDAVYAFLAMLVRS